MVKGTGPAFAVDRAWRLGINPGGEVSISEIPDDQFEECSRFGRHRLISKAELNDAGEFSPYDRARRHLFVRVRRRSHIPSVQWQCDQIS